ncbi:LGI4 protein, partial [Cephalopterus ornatus]|nr:LGI4 protein [Cephalopterus ornatus]
LPVPPSSPSSPRSLVRWHIEVLAEGSFRHTPTLQLLLVTAGSLGTIGDGAFAGLALLEYLFIEDNEVGAIEPTALRGLRGLLFLSLANNRLETLPRGLFQGLETLSHLDLRGNPFRCDCRLRWLLSWLGTVPSSPEAFGRCRSPSPHQGTPLAHLDPRDFQCQRTELRLFQSLPFSSLGAESFTLGEHQGVALAQPFAGACALLEWDQLAGRFRAPTIINSESGGTLKPTLGGLILKTAMGGSKLGVPSVPHVPIALSPPSQRPHSPVTTTPMSPMFPKSPISKGGTSTVFRWGGRGFYPHQTLRAWHRDTHLEFLELGGRPALVVCSGARRPLVYRWSGGVFTPHTDIPHVPDVYAAKHFRLRGHVFLCLTRFLGDAKVMRWEGSMFREIQQVPARGSMIFQPLTLGGHRYVLLGNDFALSRVFRLGPEGHLEPTQELLVPTPRAFVPVTIGHRHFLVASSFKGATQIYRHVTVDLGA